MLRSLRFKPSKRLPGRHATVPTIGNNRLILIALLLAACSPAPSTEQSLPHPEAVDAAAVGVAAPLASGPADFEAPSGNIGCNYIPEGGNGVYHSPDGGAELICDRVEPAYVRFSLSARGLATLDEHVRDTGCCGGPMLPYGAHWRGGPFQCDMSEAGLVCTNSDRHGFTLSRAQSTGR